MNLRSRKVCISIIAIVVAALLAVMCYLFIIDKGQLRGYQPQMDNSFLQEQISNLHSIEEDSSGEVIVNENGVKGILIYGSKKVSDQESAAVFDNLRKNEYDGEHMIFANGTQEIFVATARYTPIVDALGYGWWDYSGNLYASQYGREAAQDKPNYRNYFSFVIRKDQTLYSFSLFCNTKNAEQAFASAVCYFNNNVV